VLALRWSDVDLVTGALDVRRALAANHATLDPCGPSCRAVTKESTRPSM
jgi:hypothetical protein